MSGEPETLESLLRDLAAQGCYPSIFRLTEAKLWRARVGMFSGFYGDGRTPLAALRKAAKAWRKGGKPKPLLR